MKISVMNWSRMARGALLAALASLGLSQHRVLWQIPCWLSDTTLVRGTLVRSVLVRRSERGQGHSDTLESAVAEQLEDAGIRSNRTSTDSFPRGPRWTRRTKHARKVPGWTGTYFAHIMGGGWQQQSQPGLYSLNLTSRRTSCRYPPATGMYSRVSRALRLDTGNGLFGRFDAPRTAPYLRTGVVREASASKRKRHV